MQEGPFSERNSVWWLVRSCVSGVVNELKSTVSKEGGFLHAENWPPLLIDIKIPNSDQKA